MSLRTQIRTAKGRERLESLALPSVLGAQRDEWLRLLDIIGEQVTGVEKWLTAFAKRMVKKPQMRWTKRGAHLLLQVRTRVLNEEFRETFSG